MTPESEFIPSNQSCAEAKTIVRNHNRAFYLQTNTVVIGNGPTALFLSYLLHGHTPHYTPIQPHPDPLLHAKLTKLSSSSLHDVFRNPGLVAHLTEHFEASPSFSYSTQAHKINVLMDTLLRPNGDFDPSSPQHSPVSWQFETRHQVKHMVLGRAAEAGGQWGETMSCSNAALRTLSYADMLSLPGYSYSQFYEEIYGHQMPPFTRPSREDVSRYYALYPNRTGLTSSIAASTYVFSVCRQSTGFLVHAMDYSGQHPVPLTISARHIVLASGIFTNPLPIPTILRQIPDVGSANPSTPLLVIGSGFTAADVVLSHRGYRKVVHLFKWNPTERPSPLKGCHPQAYPEYASIYRAMKLAACSPPFNDNETNDERTWYEGLPNGEVVSCRPSTSIGHLFKVGIKLPERSDVVYRTVGALAHHVGRRGDLSYLSPQLLSEVGLTPESARIVSGDTLRKLVAKNVEVTQGVFVVGSLTGDSLVKFGLGSGVAAAAGIAYNIETSDCAIGGQGAYR